MPHDQANCHYRVRRLYMASLATELAFEELSGIPTEPMSAMQAGQYGAAHQPKSFSHNPLTIGISVSGMVARTQEALVLSRREGAFTVAITSNPASPLASFAERTLLVPEPENLQAPGVSSYRSSLLALYLLAIRFGEATGRISLEDGKNLRRTIKDTADIIERTIELNFRRAQELANAVANQTNFVFLGYGPNYGTALFYAAKVIRSLWPSRHRARYGGMGSFAILHKGKSGNSYIFDIPRRSRACAS